MTTYCCVADFDLWLKPISSIARLATVWILCPFAYVVWPKFTPSPSQFAFWGVLNSLSIDIPNFCHVFCVLSHPIEYLIWIELTSDTLRILFFFFLFFLYSHNTDEAWYDFIFCNYAFRFTKLITNSRSTIFFIFLFLSNRLVVMFYRFLLRSTGYVVQPI